MGGTPKIPPLTEADRSGYSKKVQLRRGVLTEGGIG